VEIPFSFNLLLERKDILKEEKRKEKRKD